MRKRSRANEARAAGVRRYWRDVKAISRAVETPLPRARRLYRTVLDRLGIKRAETSRHKILWHVARTKRVTPAPRPRKLRPTVEWKPPAPKVGVREPVVTAPLDVVDGIVLMIGQKKNMKDESVAPIAEVSFVFPAERRDKAVKPPTESAIVGAHDEWLTAWEDYIKGEIGDEYAGEIKRIEKYIRIIASKKTRAIIAEEKPGTLRVRIEYDAEDFIEEVMSLRE